MRQSRTFGLLILLVLTLGVLWGSISGVFGFAAREAVYPFENLVLHARERLGRSFRMLAASRIDEENRGLERENLRLRHELTRLGALERENRRLQALLGMTEKVSGRFVMARVISRGGTAGWREQIRLAARAEDGIRVDQAVCGPDGLVGRIVSVSESTADVLLVTDSSSRVACTFDPPLAGVRGIVFGEGVEVGTLPALRMLFTVEPLRIRYLDRDAILPVGTRVVTSGLGGVYPPDLPIGTVLDTALSGNGLYREAMVEPAEYSADLTHVLVLVEGEWP